MILTVTASEFATQSDLDAYNKAKKEGKTDEQAFAVGDNCIGFRGDPTGLGTPPCCALPPETMISTWGSENAAYKKQVLVTNIANGLTCICTVLDVMPHIAYIHNGARIDLNEAAVHALRLPYGAMKKVSWGPVAVAEPVALPPVEAPLPPPVEPPSTDESPA